MNRFTGFTSAAIDAFNLVTDMPIIIFLGKLGRLAV
jgi:hypothetical protein